MTPAARWLASLLLLFSGAVSAETARTLRLEVEILDLGGPLNAAAFSAQLANPALDITGHYTSTKRIQDVTARYEAVMPIGGRWHAIPQYTEISGNAIMRSGWRLACELPNGHPAHASYRLVGASLHVPMPKGIDGLPQPSLEVDLIDVLPEKGSTERTFPWRSVDLSVSVRVRTRWSE